MGGSFKKTGGRFWRSVNKVVDPLNIMDPLGVLPSSWVAGKKPFQLDKNYGKLQWNVGGGGTTPTQTSSKYDPALMMYFMQTQSQQQAQVAAARKAQQDALDESHRQAGLAADTQAQQESQQQLSDLEMLRQAQESETQRQQQESSLSAFPTQIGGTYDISKAKQQQAANLAGGGLTNLPFYGYDSANTGVGATGRPTNVFNLPKTTDIKFGGK